jgi:hypothetical protein
MKVRYSSSGNPVEYSIRLEARPANIGRGFVWYFRCPVTFKLCRKLYLYNGKFIHRTVINGMYEKQTYSKYGRYLDWAMGHLYGVDRYREELYKKGFRKKYAGKPSKRYKWLRAKIAASEKVDVKQIDNHLNRMFLLQPEKRK